MVNEAVKAREEKWQERWTKAKLFEAVPDDRQKFFCTFPYPYVNGLPHVGHLFTMMRVETFARYQRLRGKNVLFPQGWHATGVPIAAAANRVKEKDEKQISILKGFGVSDEEMSNFEDPEYFIKYFAPRYKSDVQKIGMSIDWRREFHTTSLNPQYDRFIRWQFLTLKDKGYVKTGEHPVVWCPKDNCALGDHDRAVGEGETPQEFLLMKHRLKDGRFLVSATLRPDTTLGITNVYVHPETEYSEISIKGETWIVGKQMIPGLEGQGHELEQIGTVKGLDLIGQTTEEFGDRSVPVLPATFIDPNVGTGLVHSVPAESADDLIALQDLQKDSAYAEKYGLDPKMVSEIKPIEILVTPGVGGNPAQYFLDKYSVNNQNERKKLDEIRKELYKRSFYNAEFGLKYKELFGKDLVGLKVQDAMEYVTNFLVEAGWAIKYYELTGKVVCRCQTPAVVKIVSDQWFLDYADIDWKENVREVLGQMTLYPERVRAQFEHVIGWLKQWACAREHGLGTRLPWDERWIIESLSDSTIYMSYYTISHMIENVDPDILTKEFFDYVFLGKGNKPDVENVDEMRKEFLYWYPLDFRNSGKDLVQNHLTFMLFNHCALFPKEHWPRSIGVNGWVTVNGQKMSKSLGNVIPLRELLTEFGADASRITILNGGEGLDDPNWDSNFARGMFTKLEQILRQANEVKQMKGVPTKVDAWFESRTNYLTKAITDAMELTNFRTAIQLSFFEYGQMLKWYLVRTNNKPNPELFRKSFESQLIMIAPFVPHVCEEAWEALGNEGFISSAKWPKVDDSKIKPELEYAEQMIQQTAENLRKAIERQGKPKRVRLFIAADWKRKAYKIFSVVARDTRNPGEIMKAMTAEPELKAHGDELARLIKFLSKMAVPEHVPSESQEKEWLESGKEYLEEVSGAPVEISESEESERGKKGLPGRPATDFE